MKHVLLALAALGTPLPASAQIPPPPESVKPVLRHSMPLRGVTCQDSEQWDRMFEQTNVRNVTCPQLYPVLPKAGKANGKAVIVVPGGGYQFVSIEQEGFRVADALAARGYSAFVLKYRTLPTPRENGAFMAEMAKLFGNLGKGELKDDPPAVDDLAAALTMVHDGAAARGIDPGTIGVVGFSAGSRTAIRLLERKAEAKLAENVALVYPPMTQAVKGGPRPPMFLAIAVDDPLFVQGGLGLLQSWMSESPKIEAHLYSAGSHGFGMAAKGTTSDLWIDQYIAWLDRH
ncbi:alpha/beta hydrolase [Aquisediminimonas profunda]|uniref:alpha/beta hydrolase n=1 Tax=Aquisediminimonas profunda TaxID=1550733 RepID=UPI001C62C5D1|nr:dienelactone hydrolase family protein [Aquisediminimonas profunda]